jgi:hypothetical protein
MKHFLIVFVLMETILIAAFLKLDLSQSRPTILRTVVQAWIRLIWSDSGKTGCTWSRAIYDGFDRSTLVSITVRSLGVEVSRPALADTA